MNCDFVSGSDFIFYKSANLLYLYSAAVRVSETLTLPVVENLILVLNQFDQGVVVGSVIEDVGGHVLFGAENVGAHSHGNIIIRHFVNGLIRHQLFKEFDAEFERHFSQWIESVYEL